MIVHVNIDTTNIKSFLKEKFDREFTDSELVSYLEHDIVAVYGEQFEYGISSVMQDALIEYFQGSV